jgi:hypothetical protein
MVGFLFMMMVGLEKAWDNLEAKYNKAFGKITVQVRLKGLITVQVRLKGLITVQVRLKGLITVQVRLKGLITYR